MSRIPWLFLSVGYISTTQLNMGNIPSGDYAVIVVGGGKNCDCGKMRLDEREQRLPHLMAERGITEAQWNAFYHAVNEKLKHFPSIEKTVPFGIVIMVLVVVVPFAILLLFAWIAVFHWRYHTMIKEVRGVIAEHNRVVFHPCGLSGDFFRGTKHHPAKVYFKISGNPNQQMIQASQPYQQGVVDQPMTLITCPNCSTAMNCPPLPPGGQIQCPQCRVLLAPAVAQVVPPVAADIPMATVV